MPILDWIGKDKLITLTLTFHLMNWNTPEGLILYTNSLLLSIYADNCLLKKELMVKLHNISKKYQETFKKILIDE